MLKLFFCKKNTGLQFWSWIDLKAKTNAILLLEKKRIDQSAIVHRSAAKPRCHRGTTSHTNLQFYYYYATDMVMLRPPAICGYAAPLCLLKALTLTDLFWYCSNSLYIACGVNLHKFYLQIFTYLCVTFFE